MDKSFHSQIFGGIGRSPRTRQSSASSVISGRKSVHAGGSLRKSSLSGRYSVSGRSNQSLQIIARSDYHIVESYGLPMPVLVSEALTFSERNSAVSLNCSENGWAWAVYGRRLLVWQYKETKFGSPKGSDFVRTPQRRITTAQCRELTLPHCDIGHKASLITVFIPDGQQMASCLAISPTGDVRYWPSIAHDGSSIDSAGILEGQEFDYLLSICPIGYVLVTTTCNLVLLQIQIQNGRHTINHRVIRPPSGFFGGIGKKFASIIIGMNSGQDKENKFVKIVAELKEQSEWLVTVLADRWIQRWLFSDGNEQFLLEDNDISRKIRESFQQQFWNSRENNEIEVFLLDMKTSDSKLILLSGAVNNAHTPQMQYALVTIKQENDLILISTFHPIKLSLFYSPGTELECLDLKFVLCRNMAYVYGDKTIYPINLLNNPADAELEKIEFQSQGDKIMNATICSNIPLFFSRCHGLVSVSPSDFDPSDFLNSSFSPDAITSPALSESLNQTVLSTNVTTIGNNLVIYELDPDEICSSETNDLNCHLKAAFIFHLKRNYTACNTILKELFPSEEVLEEVDSLLDKMVISIAQDLAEDIPASDPRWEQFESVYNKNGLGRSNSLQILIQLKEKNLALDYFVEFLHAVGLWERLNAVTYRGSIKSTVHMLADINEKIIAAITLKCAQNSYTKIIEEAIELVLVEWNEQPVGNLVHQDLFYVKPTKIEDIFKVFVEMIEQNVKSQYQPIQTSILICDINSIILAILNEIIQFRISKSDLYALPPSKHNSYEYLPWTSMSGKNGLRDPLLSIILITSNGARSTGEPEIKQKLYQQMTDLIDFVLDGGKKYLESIKDHEKYGVLVQQYECRRRDLIYLLVEVEQYELAVKLAEKYLDFQILITICDRTDNQEKLNGYIEKYKDHDFSQFVINWHLRNNKQSELFERFKNNQTALITFLNDHPSLAWIQFIFNGELGRASKILFELAQNEIEYVARKKTMLSLAKLSALAADTDMSVQVAEINSELSIIAYQDQLPENLLATFGYDTQNPKVLKVEEIINLLISEENESATEFDFRKALELLNHVEDPFDARYKIWCTAILRDSWTDYDMNAPLDKMRNMIFFELINLCYLMDGELDDTLPPMEDFLNSPDLGELTSNKSFQYLLKLGYEHISELYQKKENDPE